MGNHLPDRLEGQARRAKDCGGRRSGRGACSRAAVRDAGSRGPAGQHQARDVSHSAVARRQSVHQSRPRRLVRVRVSRQRPEPRGVRDHVLRRPLHRDPSPALQACRRRVCLGPSGASGSYPGDPSPPHASRVKGNGRQWAAASKGGARRPETRGCGGGGVGPPRWSGAARGALRACE